MQCWRGLSASTAQQHPERPGTCGKSPVSYRWGVAAGLVMACFFPGGRVSRLSEGPRSAPSTVWLYPQLRSATLHPCCKQDEQTLLPPPKLPDNLPRSLQGHSTLFFHGLTALLPHLSFCFHNDQCYILPDLLVPVSWVPQVHQSPCLWLQANSQSTLYRKPSWIKTSIKYQWHTCTSFTSGGSWCKNERNLIYIFKHEKYNWHFQAWTLKRTKE